VDMLGIRGHGRFGGGWVWVRIVRCQKLDCDTRSWGKSGRVTRGSNKIKGGGGDHTRRATM